MDSQDDASFVTALSHPCSQTESCGISTQIDQHLVKAEQSLVKALASINQKDTNLDDNKSRNPGTSSIGSGSESDNITTQVESRVFDSTAKVRVDEALRAIDGAQAQLNHKRSLKKIKAVESSLVKAAKKAPGARLVIAYPPCSSHILKEDFITPLKKLNDRDFYGVFHIKEHIDFAFALPFGPEISNGLQNQLQITFDSNSDACFFTLVPNNQDLHPETTTNKIQITSQFIREIITDHPSGYRVEPGHWSISLEESEKDRYTVDILVLKRQYNISFRKSKREATDILPGETSAKRPKAEATSQDIEARTESTIRRPIDPTDIFRNPANIVYRANPPPAFESPRDQTRTVSRNPTQLTRGANLPPPRIWELEDGETAFIDDQTGKDSSYTLQREKQIAKNKNSLVFCGRHSNIHHTSIVAKVFLVNKNRSCTTVARNWKKEKEILTKAIHPNIVSLFAVDGHISTLYLEQLPPALSHEDQVLRPSYPVADVQRILQGISSALAYLKTQNIIHFDIKPANIAYSSSFSRGAVLLDFNLAHLANETNKTTQFLGTPWYVPPEFLDKTGRSFAGDIWALGVTLLWTMGKIVFPESTYGWVIQRAQNKRNSDNQRMASWREYVQNQRLALNTRNELHMLVFRMLNLSVGKRVEATELKERAAALGSTTTLSVE